ncbi:MAG: NADP-dependent malic enzyme, partial [Clostridia bacterium]|nr:NADP-dependent malic enzyme [Clostridia bacterium]
MNYAEESLKKHYEWKGKIEVNARVEVKTKEDLSLAYTPGVATPCLEIQKDESKSFELTRRWNTVAVITDGTAVLGLGDIGPVAGMPVMEGKALLFKAFGDVDAIPICIKTKDVDELVRNIYLISGSFGGINLEDISAPRCFEVERRLKEICDIPVFHDDQHGTAIVLGAALINALKVVNKDLSTARIVINGAGSAGIAIANFLIGMGAENLIVCDKAGALFDGKEGMTEPQKELAKITNKEKLEGSLAD